jgi:NifU-like protein involved in Fe-S cluster formation
MAAAERLYTPELLALAVELAEWPPMETAPLHGEVRSPTCGSTLAMDLKADGQGRIERLGMRVRACAVGQAAAAVFARRALGLSEPEIALALAKLEAWLEDQGPAPEWQGLNMIAAARDYPARHGAMLLPWRAALAALSTAPPTG